MTTLGMATFLLDIGRSLREAFFMFWETLWALVLGFTLSGVVQAFVSKETMQQQLGTRRPLAIIRAAGYGMVSSSCSYAASAMSKSLFKKGANFITSIVFMVAATNLVVELGLVLLVLMGWQFMVAEFVGGPIMILLLALGGGLLLTGPIVLLARRHLNREEGHGHAEDIVSQERQDELERTPFREKLGSPAALSDAANYAVADVTMLRKELIIGYLVAGFLAVFVPTSLWNAVFLHGHGGWTVLENAFVGPLIAVVSWVCSIGNVPLAAALWSGGISFGGVIAFIFADLIAMPLILIYAKFYGWKVTLRLVGLLYIVMVLAGLATELIFRGFHAVPQTRPLTIGPSHFSWNYTSYLNILFVVVACVVWWLAKNRARLGGGEGYAIDPVCAMQVRTLDAPRSTTYDATQYYFCSDRCGERFEENPLEFLKRRSTAPEGGRGTASQERDPVCGMTVDPEHAAAQRVHGDIAYFFCSDNCATRFEANPSEFLAPSP